MLGVSHHHVDTRHSGIRYCSAGRFDGLVTGLVHTRPALVHAMPVPTTHVTVV